jgi:hypothetical protein
MKYIKIDRDKLDAAIADFDAVLAKVPKGGGVMTTAVYAARNAYKNVLSMAILSEKKYDENNNQIKMEL